MNKKSESRKQTVLVVGATGATGRLVVQILLNQGHTVRAVVRSEEKMMNLLSPSSATPTTQRLHLTQASLLELDSSRLEELVAGCDAIICCLGHNMTRQGIWGKPKRLVAQSVQRLAVAAERSTTTAKLVLMGSIGVANPNGKDDPRGLGERLVLTLFRWWVPPHADNEQAALYLHQNHHMAAANNNNKNKLEWCVVRPDELVDDKDVSSHVLSDKPEGSLFGGGKSSRINVAHFMTELVTTESVWSKWKFHMPVLKNSMPEQG